MHSAWRTGLCFVFDFYLCFCASLLGIFEYLQQFPKVKEESLSLMCVWLNVCLCCSVVLHFLLLLTRLGFVKGAVQKKVIIIVIIVIINLSIMLEHCYPTTIQKVLFH